MSEQKVDLVILQFILKQLSEENADYCSKMISKLLNSLSVAMFHESKKFDEKIVASVQLLLNLYEFLNPNCANTESEIPVNKIIQNLKLIFHCDSEHCNAPKNNVQLNVISILSSVFKYKQLQNSNRNLEELKEFLNLCFYSIRANLAKKECSSDCLIFKLKILTIIYQIEANILCESSSVEYYRKIMSVNYLEECELADLILYQDDCVAFQALFYLIPAHIIFYKSNKVVEIIWKKISGSVSCEIKHSRVLAILCNVFDLCCDKSQQLNNRVDLMKLLFEDLNYWKLVQISLKDKDPIKRKQGLYLFKKSVDLLNSESKSISYWNEKCTFYWHSDCRDELYKVYNEIIIILEFLEEQQFHIIEPIFKLVETVSKKIIESKKIDFSWILVIYTKILMHESLQVVKWGLTNLLKLPENFFADENVARESADLLALKLNNMSLYFNNGLVLSHKLKEFFHSFSDLNASKIFFTTFIKKMCSQVWSAEALFFVTHSLSVKNLYLDNKYALWGKEIISELTAFVLKAFKTHNKMIQTGVQTELLNTCLRLTDEKDVTLENFIVLISIFFEREIVKVGSESWDYIKFRLVNSYSKEDARSILEKYSMDKSQKKATFISSMLILFHYAYDLGYVESGSDFENLKFHDREMFSLNHFQDILLLFKEIHKRPYCKKLMYDENLSIICDVYQVNLRNLMPTFIKPTLHFLKDVILYIQSQLLQISGMQDLNVVELYLKTFECITKTLRLYKFDINYVSNLYTEILKDLESNSNICSVGMFWRVRILSMLLNLNCLKLNTSFLNSYLLKTVNEPLKKDNSYSDKTGDLTLWGKMNSEYLEKKWKILEYLINNKVVSYGCVKNESSCWLTKDDLARLCTEALNIGGYGALSPVMSVLTNLLPVMENDMEVKVIINLVWKLILERKKSEEFKVLIRKFVEMVFQETFIASEQMKEILSEYANLIISDCSHAVVNILMKHSQRIELTKSAPLFCLIIGKGLIFGPVEKKDERLTKTVYSHLQYYKLCDIQEISSDFNTSNEIRARAVQKILQLDKKCTVHQTIARELIVTLLKMENELNKNRIRYFGNTHVHRVKHRLMQALLLLEPMLSPNEDEAIKLSEWLIHSLISENLQPSVRYMQEWLLVRIIIRHCKVYSCFHIDNYYDLEETKKKGLCSLIAVLYHFCPLINFDLMRLCITSYLNNILYFCFHRHFELRVYAQVVFANLYRNFKEMKVFNKTIQPYENVYEILKTFILEERKRNKNLRILINDFYLNSFHALKNYSLETIYSDLPKLAGVGSDEWISAEMFEYCGVKPRETNVPLKDPYPLKFSVRDTIDDTFESSMPKDFDETKSENFPCNYQKKIIPIKPFMSSWNDDNSCRSTVKTEGLIVVASLIDRVPNLGGLARTCEVFGASEYVINSLKHTEDKQFTSLSVTAEKWITIKEVKTQHLLDYVSEMKQEGYTIIGAEQALYSQSLNAVKFPKKSLLLLGNEREGIPPNLLPFLDICVEIPQIGLIRSLNVHVTGALFIWEYAKQHHFR